MTECRHTELRVSEHIGDNSCPNAPPIGFAETVTSQLWRYTPHEKWAVPMEMIMVAVVRLFKSNHSSEYLGAKIWYTGNEIPESA